jgi:Asp-tRNA(Asn)/Glu-tRNA(Gln) amidotransferase A subunit family amidase
MLEILITPEEPQAPPQDTTIDRRKFLLRFAAVTAATSAAVAIAPRIARASSFSVPPELMDPDAFATDIHVSNVTDLTELTLAEAAKLIKAKQIKSIDLVDAYLARIAKYEGIYQAFNTVLASEARNLANAVRVGGNNPALVGIPLAIKDNYYTAGVKTTANSYIFQNFVPSFDATAVARLKAAGGIVLGKMQMGPLATTRATTPDGIITTVNAWTPNTPSIDPGGSSSGSACSVAGRMASSSIGTQTGGSITAPSNAQGLTGLKPTMGRVSLYGIVPLTYTRDHPGPLARDAKDAAIMLQAMAGSDINDPRTQGLPKVPNLVKAATPFKKKGKVALRWPTRIGVLPGYTTGTGQDAVARAAMLATFASLGAEIVDVPLPDEWSLLTGRFNDVRLPERTEPFLEYLRQDLKLFGVSLNSWMQGLFLSGDEYLKGQRAKYLLAERTFDTIFSACDVVVQTSPVPFDIIGFPEIAFPIGFGVSSTQTGSQTIPLGAIFGGMPFSEDRLLSLVGAYQAVTDFHMRRPPDPVLPTTSAARLAAASEMRLTAEEAETLTE